MRQVWIVLLLALLAPADAGRLEAARPGSEPSAAPGLAGQLLVAEPDLGDPNFSHTVVLMVQHDENGALGLVLNRPYGKAPAGELLRRLGVPDAAAQGEIELNYGGPVQPEVGMVVHSADYKLPDTRRVTSELSVTSSPEILRAIGTGQRAGAGDRDPGLCRLGAGSARERDRGRLLVHDPGRPGARLRRRPGRQMAGSGEAARGRSLSFSHSAAAAAPDARPGASATKRARG